jgi:hypothetical protein
MRILLDQCTPVGIKQVLQEHEVRTAAQQGWGTLLNGDLIRAAESAGFEILITSDQNLAFQQNLRAIKIAIIALRSARWSEIQRVLDRIPEALRDAKPGSYIVLDVAP